MRKVCPNFDREEGMETILEVPIPEELFASMGNNAPLRWQNMATWMKAQTPDKWASPVISGRYNELSFLLYILGSPVLPLQVQVDHTISRPVRHSSIEASTAKYILQQYVAATGGPPALSAVNSICAIGQIKFSASEFHQGDKTVRFRNTDSGGFVIWQRNPDSWCMELLVSGCKVISGSNGRLSWRQSSNQQIPVAHGSPRPLRRFFQGLDPRAIANLFVDAVCIGEKIIKDEDCFILKLDTSQSILEEQSCQKYEIIHHTIWGYFSQRSGLLVKFEDSRLLSVKTSRDDGDGVFWETSTESVIDDYKYIDGVNVAHGGRTTVTVFRYGEQSANHKRELQENWNIEEVHFNIKGLKQEFFMPPTDFNK
ncbi:lipase [Lithospermum erythrorhizon]|uniref:Lipase n=1 Tax=Lithospermum erythrorhizon TaxID=34254 RepID=A0AAV3Q655_LITER